MMGAVCLLQINLKTASTNARMIPSIVLLCAVWNMRTIDAHCIFQSNFAFIRASGHRCCVHCIGTVKDIPLATYLAT